VAITHLAFQVMVGLGTAMAGASAWGLWALWRSRRGGAPMESRRRLLGALALLAPAGFVAIEAGWVVTEVGRQPWVVQGVLRTADAVTPMPGLVVPLVLFTALYVFLGVVVAYLLRRQIAVTETTGSPPTEEHPLPTPAAPRPAVP
jgi:cytochrome bd ubiquinol oxidase subunit I